MALSPEQFFHGSVHDIEGAVEPGSAVGHANYAYDSPELGLTHGGYHPNDHVHAATIEPDAWEFAGHGGRRRVYKLAPPTPGMDDPNQLDAKVWPHAVPIADRIDIAHPRLYGVQKIEGVQGTLPPIDWNQFGKRGGMDANHVPIWKDAAAHATSSVSQRSVLKSERMEQRLARMRQHKQLQGQQRFDLG